MSGLEPGTLELLAHDAQWAQMAAAELDRVCAACPDAIVDRAHIGATSIAGLSARPVLDLMIGVAEMMHSGDTIQPLKGVGYRCHGEQGVPGRRFFTLSREGRCLVHLHLYRKGAPLWESAIGFQDRLKDDPALCEAYEALRQQTMKSDPADLAAYESAKRSFQEETLIASTG
jgi:GrpB-like predicted nucleotidyltransferase (UPF0157 family)